MAYKYLKHETNLPMCVVNTIVSFLGARPAWAHYWKQYTNKTIDGIQESIIKGNIFCYSRDNGSSVDFKDCSVLFQAKLIDDYKKIRNRNISPKNLCGRQHVAIRTQNLP
jgi:hypothetical protein